VLEEDLEVAGEDGAARVRVRDQPLRDRQVTERVGDDLAEDLQVVFPGPDHPEANAGERWLAAAGHGITRLAAATAPSPITW
jgi:hypothetical protein